MLRIIDARTGEPVDAAPARRGLTRVVAHVTGHDPTALRVLLLADVLVRALELGGTPVWALLGGERRQPDLGATAAALGIRPFEDGGDTGAGLGAAQVIHVVGERDGGLPGKGPGAGSGSRAGGGAGSGTAAGSDTARVADGRRASGGAHAADTEGAADRAPAFDTARTPDTAPASGPAGAASRAPAGVHLAVAPVAPAGPADAGMPEGADPTVVRLGLLSRPRSEPAPLDADALRDAEDTLGRWRRAVAGWAREPSRAIPEEVRGELRAAWEDDLDVLGVLRILRRVETSDLPAGARFETYAYADRLLGLELTRNVGSPA